MPFRANPGLVRDLERDPAVNRWVAGVAKRGAAAVEEAAPSLVRNNGRIYGEARGGKGYIRVDSPYWHWHEYGGTNFGHRPYIRPTVQRLLSQVGGRWGSSEGIL